MDRFGKRVILLFISSTMLVGACSPVPSLWGTYPTPTPAASPAPSIGQGPSIEISVAASPTVPVASPLPVQTEAPVNPPTPTPTPQATSNSFPAPTSDVPPILYYSQSGDTLQSVALRFGVDPSDVISASAIPETGLLNPGLLLVIPSLLDEVGPSEPILPDHEIIYSSTSIDFNTKVYVAEAGGELSRYREYLSNGWVSGAESVERFAIENSINPRLLLALLDYRGNWVTGAPLDLFYREYPLGYSNSNYKGVFKQMMWAGTQLTAGYYGWRNGTLTHLTFPDGKRLRIAPDLNAGTVAIQYFYSKLYTQAEWQSVIDPNLGFPAHYARMFSDPWVMAQNAGPLFPPGLTQPPLSLPFQPNQKWSLTGGPHSAWSQDGPLAALDFAPASDSKGCSASEKWITAAAPGLVVRSNQGVVVLDLDGDGYEQTGWVILYLHVATEGRVALNSWVDKDGRIGHPSCEGGISTGRHVHIARKYNGEWVLADGPLPFNLSGYIAYNGTRPYTGKLTKGDITIVADVHGQSLSNIVRKPDE